MIYRGALLCITLLIAACSSGSGAVEPSDSLAVVKACFTSDSGPVTVDLEVAKTRRERQRGLMGREFLAPGTGMLFQYQKQRSANHGFWMYQTLIPLDIAYLDERGVIGNIRRMEPCASPSGADCPSYPAGVTFRSAVEVNAGFFEANNIRAGDKLKPGSSDACGR